MVISGWNENGMHRGGSAPQEMVNFATRIAPGGRLTHSERFFVEKYAVMATLQRALDDCTFLTLQIIFISFLTARYISVQFGTVNTRITYKRKEISD